MKNKNENKISDKWLLTFKDFNFKDCDLVEILEDMLDSEVLKYAVFQRFGSRNGKEILYLFCYLNFKVTTGTILERFNPESLENFVGNVEFVRKYILRKNYYSSVPYEIGSLEEKKYKIENENVLVNVKGQEYKVSIQDYLANCVGLSNNARKEIYIENCSDLDELKKRVVHELLHSYFDECGLGLYSSDETLMHWLDFHFFEIHNQVEKILENKKEK